VSEARIVGENALAVAIRDAFPVTPLHTLIIPRRHVSDYCDLHSPEDNSIQTLLRDCRTALLGQDSAISGFNVGVNSGAFAGQTVMHAHVHLIPRRADDVENPRGGIRAVFPEKQSY
jgi:ATP adenylyltransferase